VKPLLTIGMASFNNAQEVIFTLQNFRINHDLTDVELLVVDNYGDPVLERFVRSHIPGARYVRYTDRQGTAAPRDKVFQEAAGDWVMCVDSHVFLLPGVVSRFKEWCRSHPDCLDLIQGPIVFDDLKTTSDAWNDIWIGSMWGQWRDRPVSSEADPYEIPMMGLGLFACRKDSWLGFNKDHRGFGGEEGYIHTKYRQAGRRTLLLPFLRWWHYFHTRADESGKLVTQGVTYPLKMADKVRNYRLGFAELGLDPAPIYSLFGAIAPPRRPVTNVQIDPNGACGSKCWFCPVRYKDRPPSQAMPQELFERILDSLAEAVKLGSVTAGYTLWLSSYNDVLVDPLLEDRLKALRARGLRFIVLTNGIGLLKHHRLLHEYRDVAYCYSVDLPAGNPYSYSDHTKNSVDTFDRIIQGLRSLSSLDATHYARVVHIGVNGAYDAQWSRDQLKYPLPVGDTDRQVAELKVLLPMYPRIEAMRPLCDRAGHLSTVAIDNKVDRPATLGCNRLTEWLHVNSFGEAYTCCQDYSEESKFANLANQSVHTALAASGIQTKAVNWTLEHLCRRCTFAGKE
jgi:glycosyltransferase involved in cell wall biosynthesis